MDLIAEEVNRVVAGVREEYDKRVKALEEKMLMEEREERKRGELALVQQVRGIVGKVEESKCGDSYSEGSHRYSAKSRDSPVSGLSRSENLSIKEVEQVRHLVMDREREMRKANIVIKRWTREGQVGVEQVERWLKEKLNVEVKVVRCWQSGRVVVARLENEDYKREVMRNKSKLKGGIEFIEHDLSWEERKVQERIGRWVREERDKGREVKAGYARVRIEGRWVRWEEVEQGLTGTGETRIETEARGERREGEEGDRVQQDTEGQDFQN